MNFNIIKIACLVFLLSAPALTIRCTNHFGKSVDWFIALRMTGSNQRRTYLVLTNENKNWTFANEEELMYPLLEQISLDRHKGAFWNDQPPGESVSTSYAHSKGMFFVDPKTSTGFQLTHSVPLFPNINGDKVSPITNVDSNYGQSFVCVSIKNKAITHAKKIYQQLVDTKVYFYSDNTGFADSLRSTVTPAQTLQDRLHSALNLAKQGEFSEALQTAMGVNNSETTNNRLFADIAPMTLKYPGTPFTLISKHQKMKVPVFHGFLIPGLNKVFSGLPSNFGLAVESWSRPKIESVCQHSSSNRMVVNVKRVQFGLVGQKVSQDHSKWAIGIKGGEGIVCIGGLNNMTSQEKRGGSFLCIKDQQIWNSFKNIIIDNDCGSIF